MLGRALAKLRDGLVSLAYPQMCGVCGGPVESWPDGVACANCWDDPQKTCLLLTRPVCDKCGSPLDSFAVRRYAIGDGETVYCGSCDDAPY
ncbi:MAG TPA: double zinc ribbon domain-containing protein, partial [Blastocatellia bacterium]|nr:double zinc ribbon domain-containing protein [Blastocatellia bacterium]